MKKVQKIVGYAAFATIALFMCTFSLFCGSLAAEYVYDNFTQSLFATVPALFCGAFCVMFFFVCGLIQFQKTGEQ